MCIPNSPFVMTKPDILSQGPDKKSSSPKRTKYDFMFTDCCSFLSLGLGYEHEFQVPNCASTALIDSDDDGDSVTEEDSEIEADSSTVYLHDNLTLHASSDNDTNCNHCIKDEIINDEEDTKTTKSMYTISTLTMEKFMEIKRVVLTDEEDEDKESTSRLVFLSDNHVTVKKEFPEDEESKTLNTQSTLEITPSLDTKTLQLVETTVGDTTQTDTLRNFSNPSYLRPRSLYGIERVPSLVDNCDNDDHSIVSSISMEDDIVFGNGISASNDRERISKRLFKGKRKILRPWSWNKKAAEKADVNDSASEPNSQEPPKPPEEVSRSAVSSFKPPKPSAPSAGELPKPTAEEAFRSAVLVINPTKSNDVTATTIGTDEDECYYYYGDNVPFDEPEVCSSGLLAIEKNRTTGF